MHVASHALSTHPHAASRDTLWAFAWQEGAVWEGGGRDAVGAGGGGGGGGGGGVVGGGQGAVLGQKLSRRWPNPIYRRAVSVRGPTRRSGKRKGSTPTGQELFDGAQTGGGARVFVCRGPAVWSLPGQRDDQVPTGDSYPLDAAPPPPPPPFPSFPQPQPYLLSSLYTLETVTAC